MIVQMFVLCHPHKVIYSYQTTPVKHCNSCSFTMTNFKGIINKAFNDPHSSTPCDSTI